MTVRERVLTNRLIQKIDKNASYAAQIGLGYTVSTSIKQSKDNRTVREVKKNNKLSRSIYK